MKKLKKLVGYGLWALVICGLCSNSAVASTDKTFGTGSLIIPMDGSTYQPEADGGIYVAFGLVHKLLSRKAADGVTPNPIPVYWIINDQKTSITGTDLTISSTINPVAKEYKVAGEIAIAGVTTSVAYSGGPFVIDSVYAAAAKAIWAAGFQNVNLHVSKAPFTGKVQRELYGSPPKLALMNDTESRTGNATIILDNYLQAAGIVNDPTKCNALYAPFSGPDCIYDVLTPNEVGGIKTLAGASLDGKSMLFDYTSDGCTINPCPQYNLLWIPHWEYTKSTLKLGQYKSFNPNLASVAGVSAVGGLWQMPAGEVDGDDTIMAIRDFVSTGNGLFVECAGIESMEASPYGRFLTKFDIGKNGHASNKLYIYYNKNELGQPYSQSGNMPYLSEGGHIINWRPFLPGDASLVTPIVPMAFNPSPTNLKHGFTQAKTGYEETVSVFTYDDLPAPVAGTSPAPDIHNYVDGDQTSLATWKDQWHYYVGGYMDGDKDNGYVVYLGGHKYVKCVAAAAIVPQNPDRPLTVSFKDKNADQHGTNMSITINFTNGTGSPLTVYTLAVTGISAANLTTKTTTSGDLTLDFSLATMALKEIKGMHLINSNATQDLQLTFITLDWTVSNLTDKVHDVIFTDNNDNIELSNVDHARAVAFALSEAQLDSTLAPTPSAVVSGCTPNTVDGGAGIRYVLNTLFQLNDLHSIQYVRSAPVVYKDFLYQGSFDYPAYSGHFRKFQVNADRSDLGAGKKGLLPVTAFGTDGDTALLLTTDTLFSDGNSNKVVNTGELSGRNIYGSTQTGLETGVTLTDNTKLQLFKFENAGLFQGRMSFLAPLTSAQTQDVISRRYGMKYKSSLGWSKQPNVMGGVEHAAPVIIGPSSLTLATRPTMAYVGALDGMIHAFRAGVDTAASATDPGEMVDAGKELWSFIPSSQLPKLQYFRNPNVLSNYPAVDASLAFSEVPSPDFAGQYISTVVATMGVGGNSLVALDVTDPTGATPAKPKLLWERSGVDMASCANAALGTPPCTVTMGSGSKVAIGQVTNLEGQTEYRAYITTALKDKVSCQNAQGVPLNNGSLCGGIQVYSFDLYSGQQKWRFQRVYTSGVNDVPGSLALADVDRNGAMDYVVLGDMEGSVWLLPTVPDYDKSGGEDTVIMADSDFTDYAFTAGSPEVIPDIVPLYASIRDEAACPVGVTPLASSTPCYQTDQDQPIGVSATVVTRGSHTLLAWATGGAQWAEDTSYYATYVLDITAVNVYQLLDTSGKLKGASLTYKFVLDLGEKIFGALTYSEGFFYFATAFGQVEGLNPTDDVALLDKGNVRGVSSTDKTNNWKYAADGKFRGSVFVIKGQIYATTLDGKIMDVGSGAFAEPSALNYFKLKSWREIFDLGTNK